MAASHATINHAGALRRPLPPPPTPEGVQPALPDKDRLRLQKQFDAILKGIKSPAVEETVEHVFAGLSRLREILRIVEINVAEDGPLPVTLATFALINSESRVLLRFIETSTSDTKSIKGALREALDCTSFTIRHELKKVFGHDLVGVGEGQRAEEVRAAVMRAHGLLGNCFQQSIVALARVFDTSVGGELLFDDYRVRLKQSAVLLRDLSVLAKTARRAEERRDADGSGQLIQELKTFCNGTMHYLMYKDWDEFVDIAAAVTASHGSARHGFILHCFASYLEALINQVRMRSVLNDLATAQPAPKPAPKAAPKAAPKLLKTVKKPRGGRPAAQ